LEEEIDLRPYIREILAKLKWIAPIALVIMILSFVLLSRQPDRFTATAILLLVDEQNQIRFDPRITELEDEEPVRALPEIATSDRVMFEMLNQMDLPTVRSVNQLQGMLNAELGSDPRLLRLSVTDTEPAAASQIANVWAEVVMNQVNGIYGNQNNNDILFYEQQLAQSEAAYETAAENLVAFQEINQSALISNTLSTRLTEHALLLDEQQKINQLSVEIENFQAQISALPNNTAATFADQWTALRLQLSAYNSSIADEFTSFNFATDANLNLIGEDIDQQINFLNRLQDTLDQKEIYIEERLLVLESTILELQSQLQASLLQGNNLVREIELQDELIRSLSLKLQEEQLRGGNDITGLQIISEARTPEKPTNSTQGVLLIAIAAGVGVGGVLLSLFVVRLWWRLYNQQSDA
jgi:uncharacterized protein involved in exopolysaccharide biosynthesis